MGDVFSRESLQKYAADRRAEFEQIAREDRRDPDRLRRARPQGRRLKRGAATTPSPCSSPSARRRSSTRRPAIRSSTAASTAATTCRRSPSTTTSTCSRPRATTGRRLPSTSSSKGDRYFARGTTDDKGPAITALFGARYAWENGVPANIHFLWEFEEEIGSPHFESTIRAAGEGVRDGLGRRLRHGLGLAHPARAAGGPARPAGLPLRAADRPDRPALGHGRRRRAQSGRRDVPADRRVPGRQDRARQDPRLLRRRRPAHEEGARGPEEVRLHGRGLQEGPPLQEAARRGPARGDEADLDDADLRGPRHRRRLPGAGRQDDHSAQGDGDRLLPARAEHEPEQDREARHRLRQVEEPGREGLAEHALPAYQGKTTGPLRRRDPRAR